MMSTENISPIPQESTSNILTVEIKYTRNNWNAQERMNVMLKTLTQRGRRHTGGKPIQIKPNLQTLSRIRK
jgi:hypothetical protein